MQRCGLRAARCWCLGAAAVGAAAWGIVHRSMGVGMAGVAAIGPALSYDMYSEAMAQGRSRGLTAWTRKVWLFPLCGSLAATIIGFPVIVLIGWYLHGLRATAQEGLRSMEHGGDAPDLFGPHPIPTAAVSGALAAVSLTTLLCRWIIRPQELWRAAASSERSRPNFVRQEGGGDSP